MKQVKYILFATMLSIVFVNNTYSQRYWKEKTYPIYPMYEEWILGVNGGFSATSHIGWGLGINMSKKLNPFWTLRGETFMLSLTDDKDSVGQCAFLGVGANFSISESFSGYSRNRIYDLYLSSCLGGSLDMQNENGSMFGFYANLGIGAYTRIYKNIYFNVEDKVFCTTNFNEFKFHNYIAVGIIWRIHTHSREGW